MSRATALRGLPRLTPLRGLIHPTTRRRLPRGLSLPRDVVALVPSLTAVAETGLLLALVDLLADRDDGLLAPHALFDLLLDLLGASVVASSGPPRLVSTASVPPSLVAASAFLVASDFAASLSVVVVVGHE